jgi:peptide chain release factor 2
MAKSDFWQKDQDEISRLNQQRATLKEIIDQWQKHYRETEDAKILAEMANEEDDESTLKEIEQDVFRLEKEVGDLEFQSLLGEPDDRRNAILAVNAGAGGTESQDWVEMLFRMYLRWCESRNFTTRVIDNQAGDEAGIKSVTMTISGPYAYGHLKSEHGIHRMVRISPFDATGRRHTSFASVSVLPEVDTDIKIQIEDKDLRVDTYRASGPGGQHVNKTSSAVNKDMALKVLKARLYEIEKNKREEKKQQHHQNQKEIAWGSQIRSYVFNPYRMVKDHRTNVEVGNLDKVMDGDIDMFIDAYLRI